ncbi:MAG TPA: hypothetical protein VG056_05840 [Pirellulales bacterium]|jgi:hypothetical protein|nr:hypothetical protein [Pirellulales bacterium]
MRHSSILIVALTLGVAAAGCSSSVARPNWFGPQPPQAYQQNQAQRYDPYPDDSLGPAVLGGRPRDFDRPREVAPLRPNPAFAPIGGAAPPVQLQPTPGPYSPPPYAPAPYPQTPYVAPQYPAAQAAPATPAPGQ